VRIHSLCNSCLQAYDLEFTSVDKDLIGQIEVQAGMARCPRHCGGLINIGPVQEFKHVVTEGNRLFKDPIHLTAQELYAAIYGNGLPDEIPRDIDVVESLMIAHKVVGTTLEMAPTGEIYLHSLKLSNDVTVHLGGGMGPRVVKITKPRKENHGPAHSG
jgi:hypothetical protein